MERLQNLSAINTNTVEGRLLIAAMAKISGLEGFKEPDTILHECHDLAEKIYKDADDIPLPEVEQQKEFGMELVMLINKHSKENESNTPDYILGKYLSNCLAAYNECRKRQRSMV